MKTFTLVLMLLSTLFAVGYGQPSTESKAFWRSYEAVLEKQVRHLPKGLPVKVELRDRTVIFGRYDGYTAYDQTIWIDAGHWLDDGYSLREVLDIRGFAKESLWVTNFTVGFVKAT
jgi:hypothetical protein